MKNSDPVSKPKSNLYLILDILPGASHNDILHAYNRAKMTYSNGSLASYSLIEEDSGDSIMTEIEKAFETLGNPAKRREYDLAMGFSTWAEETSTATAARNASMPSILSKEKSAEGFAVPKARLEVVQSPAPGNFEPNPEFEKQIQEATDVDGPFLKAVRIYRRLTPDQLAQRCKLSASHVLAIEDEESGKLHHPVYLRGHVRMMAQMLDLPDPDLIAKNFVTRMTGLGKISKAAF